MSPTKKAQTIPLPSGKRKPAGKGVPFPKGHGKPGPGRPPMSEEAKRRAEETRTEVKLMAPEYLKQLHTRLKTAEDKVAIPALLELLSRGGITTVKVVEVGGGEKPIEVETKSSLVVEVKHDQSPEFSGDVVGILARSGALDEGAGPEVAPEPVDAEVVEVHQAEADSAPDGVSPPPAD